MGFCRIHILHPLHTTHMKHLYSMGRNKYIHMDSYPESNETRPVTKFLMTLFVLGVAITTAGGILGIDAISPSTPLRHVNASCVGY